jgi:hypothetical protein
VLVLLHACALSQVLAVFRWAKHQDNSISHSIPIDAFVANPTPAYLRMLSFGTAAAVARRA